MGNQAVSALGGAASGAAAGTAVAPGIGTAIGGVAGALAGLLGSNNDSDQAAALQQEAAALYNQFGPVDLSNPIVLKQFTDAGLLSPQMQQALNLNMSKNFDISENAGDLAKQNAALESIKQLSQTGLSASDLAASRQLTNQVGSDTQAKTQQLLQQAQQRGQGSSGATLAAQLAANQQGSQNESSQADQLAAQSSAAKANALAQLFAGTGQVRQQDTATKQFNTQNDILRAQFLDQNATARQQQNVNAENQAQLYNTQRQQSVADRNTQQANAETLREEQAKQQAFEDQMQYTQGKANALTGQASNLMQQGQNQAQGMSQIFQGVGQGATAYGNQQAINNLANSNSYNPYSTPTSSSTFTQPQLGSQYASTTPNYSSNYAHGGIIPGHDLVPGQDSYANDTKHINASPGEMVIPLSMMDSTEHAKAFVDHEMKNRTQPKSEKEHLLTALSEMNKRLHALESK